MYAQGKNMVTCAAPGATTAVGERPAPGCSQPGIKIVTLNGVDLEFCERCAVEYEQS